MSGEKKTIPFNFYIVYFGDSLWKEKIAWEGRELFDTVFINPDMYIEQLIDLIDSMLSLVYLFSKDHR